MARKYEVCFDTQSKYYKTLKLVSLIQMRLVTIIQNLPSRPKPIVKPVKVTKYTLEHCATLSSHKIVFSKGKMHCTKCLATVLVSNRVARDWLTTSCHPVSTTDLLRPQPMGILPTYVIGVNGTHDMFRFYKDGVLCKFCNRCGSVAGDRLLKLARRCERPTANGSDNLRRIKAGLLPYHLDPANADKFKAKREPLPPVLEEPEFITPSHPDDSVSISDVGSVGAYLLSDNRALARMVPLNILNIRQKMIETQSLGD